MRRDSIFYQLFQQFPSCLFDLLESPPPNASEYRFESITVKETAFQINGVFLPPEHSGPGTVYFCEVQFQRDEMLYERLFAELFLYFYRYRSNFADWQAVIIYPSRSLEQQVLTPYLDLLGSNKVHRIFLDELGSLEELSPELGLMSLTIQSEADAPQIAKAIVTRVRQIPIPNSQAIMDLVITIMTYRFTHLSRGEVLEMLGFTTSELKKTRFYQDIKAEVLEEGRQEGLLEGRQEGLKTEARSLILRQLTRKLGELPPEVRHQVENLSLKQLEDLGEALLDFQAVADLQAWLSFLD